MALIDNDLKYIFDSYDSYFPIDTLFSEAEIRDIAQEIAESKMSPREFINSIKEKEKRLIENGYYSEEAIDKLDEETLSDSANQNHLNYNNEKEKVEKGNDNSSTNENSKNSQRLNRTAYEKRRAKLAALKKVASIKMMLKTIENNINSQLKGAKSNIKNFLIVPTISAGNSSGKLTSNILFGGENKDNINFVLDINMTKLMRLSSLEVYSTLSLNIQNSVYKQIENRARNVNTNIVFEKNDNINLNDLSSDNDTLQGVLDENKKKAIKVLSKYLQGFLSHYKGAYQEGKFSAFTDLIASQIVNSLDEVADLTGKKLTTEEILNNFFDYSRIEEVAEIYAEDSYKSNIDEPEDRELFETCLGGRLSYLSNKADSYAKDPDREPEAVGYRQQAQELLSAYSDDKFADLLGFKGQDGDSLKDVSQESLREFCKEYAERFMSANNLISIDIMFVDGKNYPLGEFVEENGKQYINVNLSKIKNRTDLMMTLSHELKHAVDASINKNAGYKNKYGGGLDNDISEDISSAKKGTAAYNVLKTLNKYCYRLNPNERRARESEMSALMFACSIQKDTKSKVLKDEIQRCVDGFKKYQKQTIKYASFVKDMLNNFSMPSDADAITQKLIDERVEYLNNIVFSADGLDMTMEEESIKNAENLLSEDNEEEKNKQPNNDKNQKIQELTEAQKQKLIEEQQNQMQ